MHFSDRARGYQCSLKLVHNQVANDQFNLGAKVFDITSNLLIQRTKINFQCSCCFVQNYLRCISNVNEHTKTCQRSLIQKL